ncbi:hypothetical protein QQ045_008700 [Rhodiola kirilowii]
MRNEDMGLGKSVNIEESSSPGNGEVRKYKSKNLVTERNRRKRLSERMLMLRSLVPKITNASVPMNKATIIVDAVSYIQELQGYVEELTNQLQEMEPPNADDSVYEESKFQEGGSSLMPQNSIHIQEEVALTPINDTKLWMKLKFSNRRGGFTKLMEAINYIGLEPTDISLTTCGGAMLISSCVEGIYGQVLEVDEIRQFLLEFISAT